MPASYAACRHARCTCRPSPVPASLDRLELLERLATALAVAEGAARGRAEEVLEPRLRRAAVGAWMHLRLQLYEPRRRRREARCAQLLPSCRADPVRRPRVVPDDCDLRPRHLLLDRALHVLERRAAEEGRRQLDPDPPVLLHLDGADDAEVDERDDGDLRVGDLLERLPHLVGLGRHHCAPAGADRRTIVISSHSGASSSVCVPRSTASTSASPTRAASAPRSSGGSTPSAYGQSASTAAWKRGSSRSRPCHNSACSRW